MSRTSSNARATLRAPLGSPPIVRSTRAFWKLAQRPRSSVALSQIASKNRVGRLGIGGGSYGSAGGGGGGGSGDTSSVTIRSSMPDTPSTKQWWVLAIIPDRKSVV